ncbi:putative tyrosinase-like protein tyr-3 [Eriocheir sinensis]|uniref:putative tyrosinase-like protein tyr-3 n=1 Tax=Eriocheir sinensis TaxID=95602 RepID=UPI0021C7246E|nr:putative tyrosinase-like protein tyr-3 [Eriocheir sinensis]
MALSCLQVTCAAAVAVIFLSSVAAEGCSDRNPKCFQWAMLGECIKNRGYMHVHCAESCHQCVVQDEACQDYNEQCPAWANNNECKKNYSYMRATCARACSFCVPANDHSVPHLHANVVDSHWDKFNSLHPDMPPRHG